ncbi:porin family protein [Daejeonella oryzae]|uniref:porin family protein n=1 Tax=Daejeonella oryzae TaxID=1122943 RepID=UPI0003F7546B|nr:porin family protein [Daejeonella oryzae]
MKKYFLIAGLLLTTSVAALAQLPSFTGGLKAGVNYSELKSKESLTDANSILGYQFGAWTRVGGAGLYLQPEIYLGSKGGENPIVIDNSGNETQVNGKVKFTTLDVPVLLGTKFGPSKLNFRLMAGPVISFIVDKSTTTEDAYASIKDYKDQAIGAQAGAGVDVGNISVDLRYEAGLSNISKSEKYDQKQNLFHLSLGFKLF